LNDRKVPQLFLFTGAARFRDPQTYPWTMAGDLSFVNETRAFARFVIEDKPDAKIGILYQNDDYGKDHINGLKSGLGDKAASMIIAEVPYESTEPTVDRRSSSSRRLGPMCWSTPHCRNSPPNPSARFTTSAGCHRISSASRPPQSH
jgi:hypothetical protein